MKSLFTSFGFLRLLALGTVLMLSIATAQAGWCPAPKGGDGTIYSNAVHCRQSSKRDMCTFKHSKCYKNSKRCVKCCKKHCRR